MKGQATSLEAFIIIGALFIIFSVLSVVFIQNQILVGRARELALMKSECERLSNEINNVYAVGDGSESTLIIGVGLNVSNNTIRSGDILCNACCNVSGNNSFSSNVTVRNVGGNIILVGQ